MDSGRLLVGEAFVDGRVMMEQRWALHPDVVCGTPAHRTIVRIGIGGLVVWPLGILAYLFGTLKRLGHRRQTAESGLSKS